MNVSHKCQPPSRTPHFRKGGKHRKRAQASPSLTVRMYPVFYFYFMHVLLFLFFYGEGGILRKVESCVLFGFIAPGKGLQFRGTAFTNASLAFSLSLLNPNSSFV